MDEAAVKEVGRDGFGGDGAAEEADAKAFCDTETSKSKAKQADLMSAARALAFTTQ